MERQLVDRALTEGQVSGGRFIAEFEEGFARQAGVQHAVATSNGTTALHLALVALGLGPGDEVLVPAMTFVATANAVRYCGARPVPVDSDPQTWCLDPEQAEAKVTQRTKGIIPVHLFGHPADMEPILGVAERHRLWTVEDAAEALGARYKGRPVGGLGGAAIFSFFGNKTITTGEGGMVTTDDASLATRMRLLRAHGMSPSRRYWHEVVGFNYRLTNIQAALGVAQLQRLPALVAAKREIGERYRKALAGTSLTLPVEARWATHGYWMFSLLHPSEAARDRAAVALADRGIETRPFFVPFHLLPPYQERSAACRVAEDLGRRGMSLPSGASLSAGDVDEVAKGLLETE